MRLYQWLTRVRLDTADRPDDGVVGHRLIGPFDAWLIGRFEAKPDQPHTRSRRSLLGREASTQGLPRQELVRAADALDEHHEIVPIASSGIALQQPGLQRPVDRPAQHRRLSRR